MSEPSPPTPDSNILAAETTPAPAETTPITTLQRTPWQMVVAFLKHPIVSLIAGALLTGISVLVAEKDKKPVYLVSNTETIAPPASVSSRLAIYWDGAPAGA